MQTISQRPEFHLSNLTIDECILSKFEPLLPNFPYPHTFHHPETQTTDYIASNNKEETSLLNNIKKFIENKQICLYIQGYPGFGKTHLTRTIRQSFLQLPHINQVTLTTGNNYQTTITKKSHGMLKPINKAIRQKIYQETYFECDILIIDNLEQITGKKSKKELKQLLYHLQSKKRKIILTSTLFPQTLKFFHTELDQPFDYTTLFIPKASHKQKQQILEQLLKKHQKKINQKKINKIAKQLRTPKQLEEFIINLKP